MILTIIVGKENYIFMLSNNRVTYCLKVKILALCGVSHNHKILSTLFSRVLQFPTLRSLNITFK